MQEWSDEAGAPVFILEGLRPWAAFLAVTQAKMKAAAGPGAASAEESLAAGAKPLDFGALAGDDRELLFLETAREQIEILADAPDAQFAAALTEMLCVDYGDCEDDAIGSAEGDGGVLGSVYDTMLTAWLSGDVDALTPFVGQDQAMGEAERRFLEEIYAKRNARWAERIDALLDEETGVLLIAVGAGHFVADQSVLTYLARARDRGDADPIARAVAEPLGDAPPIPPAHSRPTAVDFPAGGCFHPPRYRPKNR